MANIVEAVPNFSEGRDQEKIKRLMSVFCHHPDIKIVNCEPDADYNRTVVTLLGDGEKMVFALMDLVGAAVDEIDLNHHKGEHPRMGAVDVIPFIPIEGVAMKECVAYAEKLGSMISDKYQIPVFLYAEAARNEERAALPNIRKGEFEGMKTKITEPKWHPDFGEAKIHPTFGVVAVGARPFLIAYNIDLATKDEEIAKTIAKAIRKSNGGFQYIQAGPVFLEKRGHVQVTMNILDYKKNPIYRIFETVKMEARRYHVKATGAEIVGMIPKDALIRSLEYYRAIGDCQADLIKADLDGIAEAACKHLLLRDFSKAKIIESYLEDRR
ncbi:MAG: glutamate formimidoyltransferase [Candidatus Izemoplasmatales bacterium]|jgi:glutamate formiminotransferase